MVWTGFLLAPQLLLGECPKVDEMGLDPATNNNHQPMFRFTVHGSQAKAWFQTCPSSSDLKTRRIYRWGDMWGTLDLQTLDWVVERRTTVQETEETCLERVEILKIQAPPTKVDDIWDEEYLLWKEAVWNGVVSVCLPAAQLAIWCARNGFDASGIPLSENLTVTVPASAQAPAPAPSKTYNNSTHGNQRHTNQHPQNRYTNQYHTKPQHRYPQSGSGSGYGSGSAYGSSRRQCLIMDD